MIKRFFVSEADVITNSVPNWPTYTIDASELGIGPGNWPEQIETDLGNKFPFHLLHAQLCGDNELAWIDYRQSNGTAILRVYND